VLKCGVTDAYGARFAGDAVIGDNNVGMTGSQVSTSSYSYGDIIESSCVVKKRPLTYCSIFVSSRIFKKCGIPNTRVLVTDGVSIEAKAPLAVLSWPVVLLRSALEPLAVFSMPVTFSKSAFVPTAVLLLPVVLKKSAASPLAVLAPPVVLPKRASAPVAVLSFPVLLKSAPAPVAVLAMPVLLLKSVR